jgi:GR25 family glycosyltransferase involved in LPS biosynthesis
LEQAAEVTGLELTIPVQPIWTDEDVDNFKWHNKSESEVMTGTVKAWLSHHVVLREFLESGQETALIFEDDIDWDIRLKTVQVPLAQRAARSLGKTANVDATVYPWGAPKDWDLLYLGHCGDYLNQITSGVGVGHHHPSDLEKLKHVLYEDPSMLNHTDLHPYTASFLTALTVPERTRVLHHSVWPLCTFGYAITRRTAERLLNELAPAKEDIKKHITAYDAAILTACRDNYLLCYTLQPELFHHMEGESLIAGEETDPVPRPPVDAAGLEQVKWRKETSNIGCGFWSGEFYPEGDKHRLEMLQQEVIGKGQCLKPDRHP